MRNILEYLERSAAERPDKVFAVDVNGQCTYGDFLRGARAVGSLLCRYVGRGDAVVVFAEKSIPVLRAFMGAVYAGAFYIPVDPGFPVQRIRDILSVAAPKVVFAAEADVQKLREAGYEGRVLELDAAYEDADEGALEAVRRKSMDTDPLYGIFTSGSTGIPKCVLVPHRSVIDFITVFIDECGITSEDVMGNQAPFDFDVSVKDIYSAIFAGASIVLIPKAYFMFPNNVVDMLDDNGVTTLIWAVSALCLLVRLHGLKYKTPARINKIMFSGETMPLKQLSQWQEKYPDAAYINLYGPTEITCNCAYHILTRTYSGEEKIPIGRAFRNERVFLLDEDDCEVTGAGIAGEICVAGTTLSLGYFRNPEMTARAFVQNPLNRDYPETVYRTGDLAYYGEDGLLYFAGRKDNQIKHMGHRIELEEVESAVNSIEGVERCCAFLDEKRNRIVGVYVGSADRASIADSLRSKVPEFMIPNVFVSIDNIPVTKNGKMDRKLIMERYRNGEYTV